MSIYRDRLLAAELAIRAAVTPALHTHGRCMKHHVESGEQHVFAATAQPPADLTDLDALHGRVVYLDFWASWCVPCRQSFPWMSSLQSRYADRGFTVVAVNLDHERGDADAFLKLLAPGFQIRFDPQGAWARYFEVQGMPTSVILDRTGRPRFTHIGFNNRDAPQYEAQIQQLLAEGR